VRTAGFRAVEAHPGEVEGHPRALEALIRAVEAHSEVVDAPPGVSLRRQSCFLNVLSVYHLG
jgi:hypothetical protein